jgi:RNA polymerase sigma-70 factor (ECF subfamily)
MGRVREGEVALLGELFERHHQRLYHFFLRLARSRSAAEDLVQEVFVRMLKYRHTFRVDSEFVPWMFTLARNAATDLYRARPKELPETEDTPEPAADLPHPIEGIERAEQAQKLQRALARLAPERREILVLARFSELKYDRIAEMLGISEGAVKVRVHRALKDLKEAFHADFVPGVATEGEAG